MRRWRMLVLALILANAGASVEATEVSAPVVGLIRQPTDKWIVEFNDAQCIARREYGSAERPLNLVLKQPPVGDVIQLAIVEQRSAGAPDQKKGQVQFDDAQLLEVSVLEFQPKGSKLRTNLINLPLEQFNRVRSAKTLRVKTSGLNAVLALTDISPLMAMMDLCVRDLRQIWTSNKKSRSARGNLSVFTSDDYPRDAITSENSGTVTVSILIDERGHIADCSIVGTSGAAALDAQTCALLQKRARLTPAVDLHGKPTKDAFTQHISWRLEG